MPIGPSDYVSFTPDSWPDFTPNFAPAQSATASSSIAYSTAHMVPPIEREPGWHVRVPVPQEQYREVAALPRFEPVTLEPALPIEWVAVPFVLAVAAVLLVRSASRYVRGILRLTGHPG